MADIDKFKEDLWLTFGPLAVSTSLDFYCQNPTFFEISAKFPTNRVVAEQQKLENLMGRVDSKFSHIQFSTCICNLGISDLPRQMTRSRRVGVTGTGGEARIFGKLGDAEPEKTGGICSLVPSLKLTAIAPEIWWLESYFHLWGPASWQKWTVSFRSNFWV